MTRLTAIATLLALTGCHAAIPMALVGAIGGFGTRAMELDTAVIKALTPQPAASTVCVPVPVGSALNGVRDE